MGALGQAMAASARVRGVELRLGCRVSSIDSVDGRAAGVTLASGEQLRAALVVSSADPVTTFKGLVGFRHMETGMARRVSQVRCEASPPGCTWRWTACRALPASTARGWASAW